MMDQNNLHEQLVVLMDGFAFCQHWKVALRNLLTDRERLQLLY